MSLSSNFACKVTTNIWNTQGFEEKNANFTMNNEKRARELVFRTLAVGVG